MAKIIHSFAIAFFAVMTVFISAAEACISCEHVPVVARSSPPSDSAKRAKKKPVYRSTKKRKTTAKKRVVKRKATAKKVETAKTAPIKTETDSQNSTISTASLHDHEIAETEARPEDEPKTSSYVGCKTNGNTLSVGCIVAEASPSDESKMTENLGCKRFLSSVGMTFTVPCE